MAHTYKGKNLEDCTKAELITALVELGKLYENALDQNKKTISTLANIMGLPTQSSKVKDTK